MASKVIMIDSSGEHTSVSSHCQAHHDYSEKLLYREKDDEFDGESIMCV
jgi:hypothetical protein